MRSENKYSGFSVFGVLLKLGVITIMLTFAIPGPGATLKGSSPDGKTAIAHIKIGGNDQTVLVFGGGYDVRQNAGKYGVDPEGRALYITDATTGSRVWWASTADSTADLALGDMAYSVLASVTAGDVDADGYTDVAFTADLGGQIWRFDFDNSGYDTTITGGVIARLAGDDDGGNRRFFVRPDVSLIRIDGTDHFAVAIGSGSRDHPLSTEAQDRFYMLFLEHVYSPPTEYTVIEEDDLVDVTTNRNPDMASSRGWRLDLLAGETILAKSRTVDGTVMFTTYKPPGGKNKKFHALGQGTENVYALNVYDARPARSPDSVGGLTDLTPNDRFKALEQGGIQPEPQITFTDDDHQVVIVALEKSSDTGLYNP